MTNAELLVKIKAEIERLKDENNNIRCDSNKAYCQGYGDAFVDLLPFLDTLESEKPMNLEGLEKAVVDYFEGYWPGMETAEQCNTDLRFTPPAIMRLARHFAQWGAERQKEQMLKEAVEGEVKDFRYLPEVNYASAKVEFDSIPDLKVGDKVRVLVIPNTDEK